MKKTKLTRTLMAACSVVVLSAAMYGCTHDDDDGPAVSMPTPAETALAAARTALAAAVTAAEKAVEAADDDDDEEETADEKAAAALEDAQEYRDGDAAAALAAAKAALAWATAAPLVPGDASVVALSEITVGRTAREDDDSDGWEKLEIATEAVAYAEGKTVLGPDGAGTTDELPMRSITVREFGSVQGDDGSEPCRSSDGTACNTDNTGDDPWINISNSDGDWLSSIEVTDDGVVIRTSGDAIFSDTKRDLTKSTTSGADGLSGDATLTGTPALTQSFSDQLVAGGDLEEEPFDPDATTPRDLTTNEVAALVRYAADNCWGGSGATVECANFNRDDLTIAFGEPSQAPDGSAAWYWRARVPLAEGQDPDDEPNFEGNPVKDWGQYELWLSNYAGLDEGTVLTDGAGNKVADQGAAADDDAYRYLSYAAYGLFHYLDNAASRAVNPAIVRSQAFHFGYDAFEDTGDLDEPIVGTFKGRTLAQEMVRLPAEFIPGFGESYSTDRVTSLRGDIELVANIGGGINTITGTITGLERHRSDGGWIGYSAVKSVGLTGGTIEEDGSYSGMAQATIPADADNPVAGDPPDATLGLDEGSFAGAFYGPVDALETAGWWYLGTQAYDPDVPLKIIGSFGAVCTKGCE